MARGFYAEKAADFGVCTSDGGLADGRAEGGGGVKNRGEMADSGASGRSGGARAGQEPDPAFNSGPFGHCLSGLFVQTSGASIFTLRPKDTLFVLASDERQTPLRNQRAHPLGKRASRPWGCGAPRWMEMHGDPPPGQRAVGWLTMSCV